MEKELQSKLVEILTAIQTATGKAADFTMAQLPDIAQSYVVYGRISSLLLMLITLIAALGLMWFVRWLAQNPWKGDFGEERGATNVMAQFFSVIGACVFGFMFMAYARESMLVWFAPKVWLLKELAQLVK